MKKHIKLEGIVLPGQMLELQLLEAEHEPITEISLTQPKEHAASISLADGTPVELCEDDDLELEVYSDWL